MSVVGWLAASLRWQVAHPVKLFCGPAAAAGETGPANQSSAAIKANSLLLRTVGLCHLETLQTLATGIL